MWHILVLLLEICGALKLNSDQITQSLWTKRDISFAINGGDDRISVPLDRVENALENCHSIVSTADLRDILVGYTMCTMVSRILTREGEGELIGSVDLGPGSAPFQLFRGDDPGMLLFITHNLMGVTEVYSERIAETLLTLSGQSHNAQGREMTAWEYFEMQSSPEWMDARASWASPYFPFFFSEGSPYEYLAGREVTAAQAVDLSSSDTGPITSSGITLGITTCKRLKHFLTTVKALTDSLGSLPNALIERVVVVDDGSSDEDREAMRHAYPSFEYLLKGGEHGRSDGWFGVKGHGASMNILVEATTSQYFMYLEDDWAAWSRPGVTKGLAPFIVPQERPGAASEAASDPPHALPAEDPEEDTHPLVFALGAMLSILRSPASRRERVVQVLFNEQGTRTCAMGLMDQCDASKIGTCAWPRWLNTTSHGDQYHEHGEKQFHGLPYALNEFGVIDIAPHAGSTSPSNETPLLRAFSAAFNPSFADWPSLSLNPGLWDLGAIKALLGAPPGKGMFDPHHETFEMTWSIAMYAAGARMAYMHGLFFEHIGQDVSAYVLNGQYRPWDPAT